MRTRSAFGIKEISLGTVSPTLTFTKETAVFLFKTLKGLLYGESHSFSGDPPVDDGKISFLPAYYSLLAEVDDDLGAMLELDCALYC